MDGPGFEKIQNDTKVYEPNTVKRERPAGLEAKEIKHESLILAQDERWRRA